MRALVPCIVLTACAPSLAPVAITVGGSCPGMLQGFVGGNAQDLGAQVADGTRVEVRCVVNGAVVSWGVAAAPVSVPLWPVGSFVPLGPSPETPRAGHTVTPLLDGTFFIAGGYAELHGERAALSSTERFDPKTLVFTSQPSMVVGGTPVPRAFHTATLLEGGEVLLHGGETYAADAGAAISLTLAFDPSSASYGLLPMDTGGVPRSHHFVMETMETTPHGYIFFGGVSDGAPVPDVEVFWDSTDTFDPVNDVSLPSGVAAVARSSTRDELMAVDVNGYVTYFNTLGGQGTDAVPMTSPVTGAFTHGDDLVIIGATGSSVLDVATHAVSAGPPIHVAPGSCTLTLGANAWLAIGGDSAQGLAGSPAGYTARAFDPPPSSRVDHSCTALDDGTVLVLGGRASDGRVLGDAWRFVPPADWR